MKHVLCLAWSSKFLSLLLLMLSCLSATAQVNSGSNGSDGAFNPTGNVTINMADHPDGIYHYTTVNIPLGVTVTFTPNANNTPVVWLVQGDCIINGGVDVSGNAATTAQGASGGPGGWRGGSAASPASQSGEGPGGGNGGNIYYQYSGPSTGSLPHGGTYATVGTSAQPEKIYGNPFILPLLGGSGGGGGVVSYWHGGGGSNGGGGGGGAILIASSGTIINNGNIRAVGGNGLGNNGGSGGAVRLIAMSFSGGGAVLANGGSAGGAGRIRIDAFHSTFSGSLSGTLTQGFQPIIIPASGQGVQLAIQSIGGVSVAGSPNGVLANPDVILPAQQTNPMNVVVNCSNLPMNTTITVTVRPANGVDIVATGTNSSGTQTASTATIPVTMPRGGGIIFAKCVSGVAGSASVSGDDYGKNIAQTGWTAHGERFAQMAITAGIGSSQQVAYITESGKRYTLPMQ